MKYEPGDRVRLKTLDALVSQYGIARKCMIDVRSNFVVQPMQEWLGGVVTITQKAFTHYIIEEDDGFYAWTDNMIEGKEE